MSLNLLNSRYLKASPTRRVTIPKPGRDEKRPLGIPTMYDRALQALVKLSMEPEWEGRFEPNSYGLFRRSTHDAICGLTFGPTNLMERDHITPRSKGGDNTLKNKQLLHRHCDDTKTALGKKTDSKPKASGFTRELFMG